MKNQKRFKILKTLDNELTYVCFDYVEEIRSLHVFTIFRAIHNIDEELYVNDDFEWNDPEQYEKLYEFDSIEEFKEQYPEEFI